MSTTDAVNPVLPRTRIFYGSIVQASRMVRANLLDSTNCGRTLNLGGQASLICLNSQTCYPEQESGLSGSSSPTGWIKIKVNGQDKLLAVHDMA